MGLYVIYRNRKQWGTYTTRKEAMDAWDKAVDYAIAPDVFVLKHDDRIMCEYRPLPDRGLRWTY